MQRADHNKGQISKSGHVARDIFLWIRRASQQESGGPGSGRIEYLQRQRRFSNPFINSLEFWDQAFYAHKRGEVVGSAGGETDGPRCLAEVRESLKNDIISYFKETVQKVNFLREDCQTKTREN